MRESIQEKAVNLAKGFKGEALVNIGVVLLAATSLAAIGQRPLRDAISECRPTFGLVPQTMGHIPHLVFPPGCYTLQSGAGQVNNSSVSLAPVRW